ncbi:MAG: transposase, partial [Flavobacteriales bacterium]|nr:transposase [Flavobacteriales bacterium]
VFEELKRRGVEEVGMIVSDGLSGIEDVVGLHFPHAQLQLCVVHLQRNVLKQVRPKDREAVAADFRQVFRTQDSSYTQEQAKEAWWQFTEKWGRYYAGIKRMQNKARMEWYFTYLAYDYRIQNMLYSTNWIERLNRDYKRVTRMRGALPNPQATILLLGHVAMTRKAYERKVPKLNYETEKFKWES